MQIKIVKKLKLLTLLFPVILLIGVSSIPALAAAKTATKSKSAASGSSTSSPGSQTNNAASIQGYSSSATLQDGLIVKLTGAGADAVAVASENDVGKMYGVTVDPNQLSYTVSSSNLQNEVYVSTSGTYNTIVSTQNGPIVAGDYVTISSIDGIAMGAGISNTTVFGRAAAAFNGKAGAIGTETLKNSSGATVTVQLGMIPIAIEIEHNPDLVSTKANLPKPLQRIGLAVAQKPIGPLQIYMSIAISVTSIVIAITVLYAGIRSSLISIGRNPLYRKSIFRALFTVIMTAMVVLIIGFLAVYLLLKL